MDDQYKWNTMEVLVVLEVICKDSNNEQSPVNTDYIQCTQNMW